MCVWREWHLPSRSLNIALPPSRDAHCALNRTGVKCLPQSKVRVANGNGIHDWHAEILALRAFNNFLLTECRALAADPAYDSFVLQRAMGPQPFEMKDVRLYLYASEAPCRSYPHPFPPRFRLLETT